jgi:hypothetical protein
MRFHALRMPVAGTPRSGFPPLLARLRAMNGFLAAAISLSLVVAASATLLHAAFEGGFGAAISTVSTVALLALALLALDVALMRFAPGGAERL